MEVWFPFISEYGFPVVVTLYLLHRVEKKLDAVNQSVVELPENISKHLHYRYNAEKKSAV